MEQILTLLLGILLGGIMVYVYMRKKGIDLKELLTDNMVKNRLLKEEINKSSKPKKKWNGPKKRYYGKKNKAGKKES